MIAHLRGTILEKHPNQVIVDAGGVGYDVTIPISTFSALPAAGAEVRLRIHTHVREDALSLYGFLTAGGEDAVREADRRQRHRPQAGRHGALRPARGGSDRARSGRARWSSWCASPAWGRRRRRESCSNCATSWTCWAPARALPRPSPLPCRRSTRTCSARWSTWAVPGPPRKPPSGRPRPRAPPDGFEQFFRRALELIR